MKIHAMIDIETVGTKIDAPIIEIGAVKFTKKNGIIQSWSTLVTLESQTNRKISVATLKWWLNKDPILFREKICGEGMCLCEALNQLAIFLKGSNYFWANSPNFDCSILEHAYVANGIKTPWSHRDLRDYRTKCERKGRVKVAHTALADAQQQARNVIPLL